MRTDSIRQILGTGAALALAGCLWIPAAVAQASDGDLQASVAAALSNDTALQGQQVKAYTANRVVTLSGTVQTQQQRQEAETVAANVPGVAGIQDNITVAGGDAQTPVQAQEQAPPPPDEPQAQQAPATPQQAVPQQTAPQGGEQLPPPPPADQPPPARQPYQGSYQGYGTYPPPQPVSGPVTVP